MIAGVVAGFNGLLFTNSSGSIFAPLAELCATAGLQKYAVWRKCWPRWCDFGDDAIDALGCIKVMKQNRGFTLVELMVAIAVMAILAAVALPSFRGLILNTRIVSTTNELVADFAMARSEAAKRGIVVTVCASTDGSSCSGGTDWSVGRLVFVDAGSEGSVDGPDSGNILRRVGSVSDFTVISAGFSSVGYVAYRGDGSVSSTAPGTLTICGSGLIGRVISISNIGRTKLDPTAAACP